MNLWQSILEALESLSNNKMRSALTILGIVIGVGAVIAMMGVGAGAQNAITGSISGIGTNLVFIIKGNASEDVRNPKDLTMTDAIALQDVSRAPAIVDVSAVVQRNVETTYETQTFKATLNGAPAQYFAMRNYELLEGEFFTEEQDYAQSSVAVIGTDVADKLFGRRNGITGETIRISGIPFRVIGVLTPKGGGMFGSEDSIVLVPLSTAQIKILRRSNLEKVDMIMVQAVSPELVKQATDQATLILRDRHKLTLGANDFTAFSQDDFIQTAQTITSVITLFLGGVAAISLLVGGIGIMNIMLVSVTERTREIGLRKALGARKRDIMVQFLTESALLSLVGGLIGIGLGWSIAFVVGEIAAASNTPLYPAITLEYVLLATLFSAAVGLFFGLYPANRAANLEPVEALRHE